MKALYFPLSVLIIANAIFHAIAAPSNQSRKHVYESNYWSWAHLYWTSELEEHLYEPVYDMYLAVLIVY